MDRTVWEYIKRLTALYGIQLFGLKKNNHEAFWGHSRSGRTQDRIPDVHIPAATWKIFKFVSHRNFESCLLPWLVPVTSRPHKSTNTHVSKANYPQTLQHACEALMYIDDPAPQMKERIVANGNIQQSLMSQ